MNSFLKNKNQNEIEQRQTKTIFNVGDISEDSPFRASAKVRRSPPRKDLLQPTATSSATEQGEHLDRLKLEEETAFVKLGNKISAMNSVVCEARNIHKSVRDNLQQAVALYQQLREYREAIALNSVLDAPQRKQDVAKSNKHTQTDRDNAGNSSKRAASSTPEKSVPIKKVRTTEESININGEKDGAWTIVRKKKNSQNKKKVSGNLIRTSCEKITIKAAGSSYADILKEMKTKIKPEEIGVGIKKIRKTNNGDVLIEMTKGDGQAKKLESAIKGSLGDNVQVQTAVEKFLLDIRDMEETTDEGEIINAIQRVSSDAVTDNIKVRNIRDYYGGTKQALVEVPGHIAEVILKLSRIKIGFVLCRVRRKLTVKRCYRCLEQGHFARTCSGKDRSKACRKCGKDGHKSNICQNEPRCLLCLEAGRQSTNHYIGTSALCKSKNET